MNRAPNIDCELSNGCDYANLAGSLDSCTIFAVHTMSERERYIPYTIVGDVSMKLINSMEI